SPSLICAPTRMIPFSSKSFVASSETFGISGVSSSSPSFVSRTSSSYSEMWTEVNKSSFPWHEGHFQVLTKCQLTILGSVSFSKEVALFHLLAFFYSRFQVD